MRQDTTGTPLRRLPRWRAGRGAALAAVVVLVAASRLQAQDSRAGLLEAEQARKSTQLHPYRPDALERYLLTADSTIQLITHGTVYPFIGKAFDGGGLTIGPGLRGRAGRDGRFDVHAGWSVKNYKTVDATLALPTFASGRLGVLLRANWLDAPDVPLYARGNDSPDVRSGYAYRSTTLGVDLRFQATRSFALGTGLDAIDTDAAPEPGTFESAASPRYRRARAYAEFDTRTSPGYTRRGALYRAEWSDYAQTNGGTYSFRRADLEARQFVPLFRETSIVALRALASTTTVGAGDQVPYFLMPDLGGSTTLRGYSSWRFRDRSRLLLSGEYRWTAGSFVDMSVFMDAGKVAPRAGDLGSAVFKKSYGVGLSIHTAASTVARIEVARTAEGTAVLLSLGPSF
jgi:hypothetical protein